MSNRIKRFPVILGVAAVVLFLAGCEDRDAAERAGGNLGRGLANLGEEVDQAAGNVKRIIDNHTQN